MKSFKWIHHLWLFHKCSMFPLPYNITKILWFKFPAVAHVLTVQSYSWESFRMHESNQLDDCHESLLFANMLIHFVPNQQCSELWVDFDDKLIEIQAFWMRKRVLMIMDNIGWKGWWMWLRRNHLMKLLSDDRIWFQTQIKYEIIWSTKGCEVIRLRIYSRLAV